MGRPKRRGRGGGTRALGGGQVRAKEGAVVLLESATAVEEYAIWEGGPLRWWRGGGGVVIRQ